MSDLIKQIEELNLRCDSSTLLPVILQVEQLLKERDELRQQVENIKNGFEGGCYLCEVVGEMNKRLQKERDEARRVLKSIVDEFVQHAQPMNPFYPATPMHECEFSWNPESGKCDACEAWGDYVLICHPLEETDEEETT